MKNMLYMRRRITSTLQFSKPDWFKSILLIRQSIISVLGIGSDSGIPELGWPKYGVHFLRQADDEATTSKPVSDWKVMYQVIVDSINVAELIWIH